MNLSNGNSGFSLRVPLALVFITGVLLRLWKLGDFSITADELSALSRIQVSGFRELISLGVVPDFHPAGVQVFLYYYCKVFGTGEWAIRFPFFLCGALSLPLVYLIAKEWFGEVAGLFSLSLCSVSQLFILYSRLARPYAPGLLFCLLLVWMLQRMLQKNEQAKPYRWLVPVALSMAGAMYTHYLAFFFAAMAGASAIFFSTAKNRIPLLLSGLLAVLLFLPHLSLTLLQLGYGGVGGPGGWLSAPTPAFFYDFILFLGNDSKRMLILFAGAFLLLTGFRFRLHGSPVFVITCMLWSLVPPVFAYVYSIKVNPILQVSGLLFSTPFLFIAASAFVEHNKKAFHSWLMAALVLLAAGITIGKKRFYERQFFGEYLGIAKADAAADARLGKNNITHVFFAESEFFATYSLRHFPTPPVYAGFLSGGKDSLAAFTRIVQQATTDYFSYAWSNLGNPYEVLDIIREKYPCLAEKKYFFNSEWYLFSKKGLNHPIDAPLNSISLACDRTVLLHEGNPYGKTFEAGLFDTFSSSSSIVSCKAEISCNSKNPSAELVMEIKRQDSLVYWRSSKLGNFNLVPGKKCSIYFATRMPENMQGNELLRFYLWAHDSTRVRQYSLQVNTYAGNPGLYSHLDKW